MPRAVDGGGGDDEQVDVVDGDRAEHLADGLGEAEHALGDVAVGRGDRPVEQAVGAGDREGARGCRAPPRASTNSRVPGSVVVDRKHEIDRAPSALDEGVELGADAVGRGIPRACGQQLASLAQLGAQGALRVGDRVGHGSILSGARCAGRPSGHVKPTQRA